MAVTPSTLTFTGEVIKSPEMNCEMEWRIPDFVSLMKRDEMFFSDTFSFNGAIWRMCMDIELIHLNVGIIREATTPPMRLEVSVGFKTLKGKKDRERYTKDGERDGREAYICFNCLPKIELLERMSDLMPSNVLTVMYTLKLQKNIGDAVRKCGLVWTANYITTHCRTCAISSTMALCSDCFQKGNHEGHDLKFFLSPAGGFCDCGDKSAMKESGFCKRHGLRSQTHKSETSHELLFVAEVLMPRFFLRLFQRLGDNSASGKSCSAPSSNILQEHKIFQDFKDLFFNRDECDVMFKVQGQEFQAHKAILKSRSSVFACIFRHDMKEKLTGVVEIEDCDPSSFSEFLCFLYCGDMAIISQENVYSLFKMADKYAVQDLRAQCLKFMKDNLCADMFCETFFVALKYSEIELLELTIDFFTKNAKHIMPTVKWQNFMAENPTQSNELLIKLLASHTKRGCD